MRPTLTVAPDGTRYRDLNRNGRLDPFEDPRLPPPARAADLLGRLSLPEKAGLLFHTVIEVGADGGLLTEPGRIAKSATREVVADRFLNHFNVHDLPDARTAARWANSLQRMAEEETAHGIPVTISTDPRHGADTNTGATWRTPFFSSWPSGPGFGALADAELVRDFGDVVRRDYRAVGIRASLNPTADLATEPRWARQQETFGSDPALVAGLVTAYLRGLQGERLGATSVSATTKHFPGGGPQADGEDAHFPYGRDQVYPGGRFEEHLQPFRAAIAAGTAAIMPYYGRPVGLVRRGEPVEAVGFGYNRQLLTALLREELGYDGVILSDWELINDNQVGDQVLPARAWGVEHLDRPDRLIRLLAAGIDQFGGEECTDLLLDLVSSGRVDEARVDLSARRLLQAKFALGLFDNPYVDEDAAPALTGLPADVARGRLTQSRSTVVLTDHGLLPLRQGQRVYAEGIAAEPLARVARVVTRPEEADLALVRLPCPFDPRDDLFLEAQFRQGSLEFRPGLVARLRRLAALCPLVIDVHLDRAAIVTPLLDLAGALTATFGVDDAAWLDAITGQVPPEGHLPFELPRSMAAVRASLPDVPGTDDPLFAPGHGLALGERTPVDA
ncbi:MAG: glycoside hydrolase family 3 N-terminal domain-containing protein [Propionicimonas sp.]